MEDMLTALLEQFGFPVLRQGSLAPEEQYPDLFFTFWNRGSEDGNSYDGREASVIWQYDVNVYGKDPLKVFYTLAEAVNLLKQHDFLVSGRGHDVASDEKTHIGRGISVSYFEKT